MQNSEVYGVTLRISYKAYLRLLFECMECAILGKCKSFRRVQRRWTREIKRIDHLEYAQRRKQLNLYSVYSTLLRADIIKCWKVFHSEVDVGLCDLFVCAPSLGMRTHTYKLSRPRCETDTKRFFNFRIIII